MNRYDEVFCELEGTAHPNEPDPYGIGPQYSQNIPNDSSELRKDWNLELRPGWEVEAWHYTCPGPHRRLWIGAEL